MGAGELPLFNSHLLAANFGELAEGRVGNPPKLAIRLVARERFAPGRTQRTRSHSGLYTPEPSRGRRRRTLSSLQPSSQPQDAMATSC